MVNRKIGVLITCLVSIMVIAGVSVYLLIPQKTVSQKNIGGKYNAKFLIEGQGLTGFDYGFIVYTKDGIEHTGFCDLALNNSMSWIKSNVPDNAVFLNWWDYGHMIIALAEREAVIKNPSQEALVSIGSDYRSMYKELDSHDRIVDVASAFVTFDENITKQIMQKYGATYLLVASADAAKGAWFFNFTGLNGTEYWVAHSEMSFWSFVPEDFTVLGMQTMLFKLGTNANLSLFTQVYSDSNVKIYKP